MSDIKNKHKLVKMTKTEHDIIEKASKLDRRSFSAFMVKCALDRSKQIKNDE